MSLKEEARVLSRRRSLMERILEELSASDRQDLEDMLEDDSYTSRSIALALRKRGFQISERTVAQHKQTKREML